MKTDELFILAADVQLIPVETVHEKTRRNFEHEENDVIISYANTRKRSKVAGENFAALLKEFQTPKTWAEAILNFASNNIKDPEETATDAYPLLKEMKTEGYIVEYKNDVDNKLKAKLNAGDIFNNYTVKETLQFLADTEVYRIENSDKKNYVLKLFTDNQKNKASLKIKNEAELLQLLDGKINPHFIEAGLYQNVPYLIIEWIDGITCVAAAKQYRNYNVKSNALKILDLCISVLHAYSHLHRQGVFHADVHPGNIFVTENGKIKIIDFGNAVLAENVANQKRSGVPFYYEPEYADALLNKKKSLPSSERGELYSVAALLYLMISGYRYIDFSFEEDKMYGQIISSIPVSFKSSDLNLPSSIDEVFAKALSKNPMQRFASCDDFANALQDVRKHVEDSKNFFVADKENAEEKFIQFILKKFGYRSSLIENGLALAPASSVNFGAAGIAYMFYRMAIVRENTELLDLADIWANRAAQYHSNFEHAFSSKLNDINTASAGRRSIYHSPTGVHLVQALIGYNRGERMAVRYALKKFIETGRVQCDKTDLTLGKAGLLIGCGLLLKELQPNDYYNLADVINFANEIMQELWVELDEASPVVASDKIKYFGMAHGWAGYLYATLFWCSAGRQPLPKNFERRTEELLSMAIEKDGIIKWPISFSNRSSWPGWCHGNAGYIFLLSHLYNYFNEKKFIAVAEKAAVAIINNTKNLNCNLCCGMAGQAYALARLYSITAEKKYANAVQKLKEKIITNINSASLINNSLYKGEVGVAVLFSDTQQLLKARMPLFE